MTTTKDTSAEAPKNPAPNVQSTKAVNGLVSDKKDPDNDASKTEPAPQPISDNTPAADAENDPNNAELSRDEEKNLERLLGNDDETTDPNRPAVAKGREPSAMVKIQKIIARIPAETPNEHVVWGAAGMTLTIGDFRELCKQFA